MDHVAGYQYNDPWIWGFTQTHLNGTGAPSLADILWDINSIWKNVIAAEQSFEDDYTLSVLASLNSGRREIFIMLFDLIKKLWINRSSLHLKTKKRRLHDIFWVLIWGR